MSASIADQFAAAVAAAKDLEPACLADLWAKYLAEIPTKGVVRSFFNYEAPRPVLLQFATQLEKLDPSVQVRVDSFGIQIFARRTIHDAATFFDDASFDKFAEVVFAGGVSPALHAFLEWKFHYLQLSGDNLLWVRDPDSTSTQYNLCHGRVPMGDIRVGTFHAHASCPSKVLPCWHVEQSHSLFSKLYPDYSFCKSWPADSRERVLDFGGRELVNDAAAVHSVTPIVGTVTPVSGSVVAPVAAAANTATPLPVPAQTQSQSKPGTKPGTKSPTVGDLVYARADSADGRLRLCTVKWTAAAGCDLLEVVQGQGILKPSAFWAELGAVVPAEPFAAAMPSQVQSNRLDPTETALFCTVIQAYMANSAIDIELHPTTRLAFHRANKPERVFGKAELASSDVLKAVWFGSDDLIVTLHCSEPCMAGLFDAIVMEPVVFAVSATPVSVSPEPDHKVGDYVVATDTLGDCYISQIIAVDQSVDSIRVHYLGCASRYDEWIPIVSSHRLGAPLQFNVKQLKLAVGTDEEIRLMLAILECAPILRTVYEGVVAVDVADGKGAVWFGGYEHTCGPCVAHIQCVLGDRVAKVAMYYTSFDSSERPFDPIITLKHALPAQSASVGTAV